jgi:thiopeptide-type bacteriocin biosynthesis protein
METYDPEEERHGGPEGLGIAERVFETDSDAALSALASRDSDPDARWHFALLGMSCSWTTSSSPAKRAMAFLRPSARRPVLAALTPAVPQGPLR